MPGSRDNLKRALIDTGEATPPRKQLQAYTSKVSGPIGPARSQLLNFHLSSSLSTSLFPSHNKYHQVLHPITRECQKHSTSTDTIALSRASDPYILVIREFKELDKTSPTHAARYQTIPINLMHKYSSNCKTQL